MWERENSAVEQVGLSTFEGRHAPSTAAAQTANMVVGLHLVIAHALRGDLPAAIFCVADRWRWRPCSGGLLAACAAGQTAQGPSEKFENMLLGTGTAGPSAAPPPP